MTAPLPPRLAALLGRTRAEILAALWVPHSTTELAEAVGVSPASASKHATILRDAGLVVSARQGNVRLHTLTELGRNLLERNDSRGQPWANRRSGAAPAPRSR